MTVIQKTVVMAEIGPLERSAGLVTVHEYALDGDEDLRVGQRVEIQDGGGMYHAAVVEAHEGDYWTFIIQP